MIIKVEDDVIVKPITSEVIRHATDNILSKLADNALSYGIMEVTCASDNVQERISNNFIEKSLFLYYFT
jgi:hypothetical protein